MSSGEVVVVDIGGGAEASTASIEVEVSMGLSRPLLYVTMRTEALRVRCI